MRYSLGELQVVALCGDRPQQCVSPGSRPSGPACGGSSAWHSGAFVFPLEQHQRACSAYRAPRGTMVHVDVDLRAEIRLFPLPLRLLGIVSRPGRDEGRTVEDGDG